MQNEDSMNDIDVKNLEINDLNKTFVATKVVNQTNSMSEE
jgi:hypothetical protein